MSLVTCIMSRTGACFLLLGCIVSVINLEATCASLEVVEVVSRKFGMSRARLQSLSSKLTHSLQTKAMCQTSALFSLLALQ